MRRILLVAIVLCGTAGLVGCSGGDGGRSEVGDAVVPAVPGPFPVGITSFDLVDPSRSVPATPVQPGAPARAMSVRVWYPAVAPSPEQLRDDDFSSVPDPSPRFDAPPATGSGPFPLIVFSHGLGEVPASYGDLLQSWAAAGFVVAAPRFPLSSGESPGVPDAGDVGNQPGDVSFVITRAIEMSASAEGRALAGMIDAERVGVAGHSNGGVTTAGLIARSCCVDPRIDAAIIIAGTSQLLPGWTFDWTRTPPVLVIHGEDDIIIPVAEGRRLFDDLRAPKGLLTLLDTDHGSFLFRDSDAFPVTVAASVDFWRGYLLGDAAAIAALPGDGEPGVATMEFIDADGPAPVAPPTDTSPRARRATAQPSSALRDGQRVRVTWSGFLPGRVVTVVQCSDGGRDGVASCDMVTGAVLRANPTGEGSADVVVRTGRVGNGTCSAAADDCIILVNDATSLDEDATIRIPLSFG